MIRLFARIALIVPVVVACTAGWSAARAANGSGRSATETRTTGTFTAIDIDGEIDLVVTQGTQQLQVEADDNLLPLLETSVAETRQGQTLQVRWKRDQHIHSRTPTLIRIAVPQLTAVSCRGSGNARIENFNAPALKLSLAGSGDAQLQGLSSDKLELSVSGSGNIRGFGKATHMKLSIAGSGDIRLGDLRADEVSVSIAGSGNAAVHAAKSLDVSIAGSGDVSYSGEAAVKTSVAGSGSVHKR
jgi:hypothetical protein